MQGGGACTLSRENRIRSGTSGIRSPECSMPGVLTAASGARTGHPLQLAVVNYEQAVEPFLRLNRLSDRSERC